MFKKHEVNNQEQKYYLNITKYSVDNIMYTVLKNFLFFDDGTFCEDHKNKIFLENYL